MDKFAKKVVLVSYEKYGTLSIYKNITAMNVIVIVIAMQFIASIHL